MPKKAAKNGFFFYMLEWKQRAEASGRKTLSLAQVQEQAGPSWVVRIAMLMVEAWVSFDLPIPLIINRNVPSFHRR